MQTAIDLTETPGDLLSRFYAENNLDPDGGQSKSYVKVDMGKGIHFYFPNWDARRAVVIQHDIHHILTGYSAASLLGEAEISAWEIGSGIPLKCWVALLINSFGMLMGVMINPRRTIRAYARGRRTRNLYDGPLSVEQAKQLTIGHLRARLHLTDYPEGVAPNWADRLRFLLWLLSTAVFGLLTAVLFPLLGLYTVYRWIKGEE